jgi:hypothetical protein
VINLYYRETSLGLAGVFLTLEEKVREGGIHVNFEPKYLVRWGIPGWMFLFVLISYFVIKDFDLLKSFILKGKAGAIVSAFTLFIGVGIILGNLIHQVSISLGFVVWNKRNRYFKNEYEMDLRIIKNKYGSDIQRIYSYRLGNVHALRALWFSLSLSLLILIILSLVFYFSFRIGVLIGVVVFLKLIVLNNWIYFQNNLNYFIRNVKSDFDKVESKHP